MLSLTPTVSPTVGFSKIQFTLEEKSTTQTFVKSIEAGTVIATVNNKVCSPDIVSLLMLHLLGLPYLERYKQCHVIISYPTPSSRVVQIGGVCGEDMTVDVGTLICKAMGYTKALHFYSSISG